MPFEPAAHQPLTDLGGRLRDLAGDAAFKAGRDYLRKGNVRDGAVAETQAYATVKGSTDYRVTVAFPSVDGTKVTCTCPAHRRSKYCKHVVAVCSALLEQPTSFEVLAAMPEPPAAKKAARASRGKAAPKVQAAELRASGLDVLDRLLLELTEGGLAQLGPEKVALIEQCAELVRALKLRRLGNLLMQLRRAVASPQAVDGGTFSRLLLDLYLCRAATGAQLDGKVSLDPRLAEDLLGKTWRAEELESVGGLELVQVASSYANDGEFVVETSYLVDLASGETYAERQITPARLRSAGAKSQHRLRLLVEDAGLYPGLAPRRIRLNRVQRAPLRSEDVDRLIAGATDSVAAIQRRLVERAAVPFGPAEVAVLFRPLAMLRPPPSPEKDAAQTPNPRALPAAALAGLPAGLNAMASNLTATLPALSGRLATFSPPVVKVGALDASGQFVGVELAGGTLEDLTGAVPQDGPFALFGLASLGKDGVTLRCLALIGASVSGGGRHRFGRIFPE
ncbi:MAG: SWIM zinc finger family protein [Chloroflexota bacterium]